MSEEMNKEAEVQEEAVDIPVTDGSEEEAADTAQTAEEETSEETAQAEEAEQPFRQRTGRPAGWNNEAPWPRL